jgi:hypothetical protein
MRAAYGVQLTNSVRKSEDPRDVMNYEVRVRDTRYYGGKGQLVRLARLALPMTKECATQLAEQLQNQAQQVRVVDLLADDEAYLPTNLNELQIGVRGDS